MNTAQKGFTLIELMIVIAIIGILAAIAIPSYQNYIKKSAYSEIPLAMSSIRTAIDTCYGIEKSLPACDTAAEIGETLPTDLGSAAAVTAGTAKALSGITITANTAAVVAVPRAYKGILAADTCTLTPIADTADRLVWNYSGVCVEKGYVK